MILRCLVCQMIDLFIDAASRRKVGEPALPKKNNLVLILNKDNDDVFASMREKVSRIQSCKTASGHPVRITGAVGLEKLGLAQVNGLNVAEEIWGKVDRLHSELC